MAYLCIELSTKSHFFIVPTDAEVLLAENLSSVWRFFLDDGLAAHITY